MVMNKAIQSSLSIHRMGSRTPEDTKRQKSRSPLYNMRQYSWPSRSTDFTGVDSATQGGSDAASTDQRMNSTARFLHVCRALIASAMSDSWWPYGPWAARLLCPRSILQARILQWVAKPSPRGPSWPRTEPKSLTSPALAGGSFITSTTWKPDGRFSIVQSWGTVCFRNILLGTQWLNKEPEQLGVVDPRSFSCLASFPLPLPDNTIWSLIPHHDQPSIFVVLILPPAFEGGLWLSKAPNSILSHPYGNSDLIYDGRSQINKISGEFF